MAQVPIPWFKGYSPSGENLYAGRSLRKQRTLQAITQGMYDVGALLRHTRSQGLPPGATDQDLIDEENALETQLGQSQVKARDDTTHGVERASTEGDPESADAIKNDPAGYASTKHEESQGFLPKLGHFMKTGVERLVFGDPSRGQRVSHIRQMKGQLAAEKDKENFLKNVGTTCMKSEDPDRCLQEMGGGRYGIHSLPKMIQRPLAGAPAPGDVPPPGGKYVGNMAQRGDWVEAVKHVRDRHGGSLPEHPEEEIYEEWQNMQRAKEKAKGDDHDRRQRALFDYKEASYAARRAEAAFLKEQAAAGVTRSESWTQWKDVNGKTYIMDDLKAADIQMKHPDFGLTKMHVTVRRKLPAPDQPAAPAQTRRPPQGQTAAPSAAPEEPDPGDEWGVKFYAPLHDERGGQ